MAVSRARSVEGSRRAGSLTACRPVWPGFRTTCWLAGTSPWCGSKEERERQSDPWNWACPPRSLPANSGNTEEASLMVAVMIGVDPHKASHTAVAIGAAEESLAELRIRACQSQAGQLLAWAQAWPQRTWAVEAGWRCGAPAGPATAGRGYARPDGGGHQGPGGAGRARPGRPGTPAAAVDPARRARAGPVPSPRRRPDAGDPGGAAAGPLDDHGHHAAVAAPQRPGDHVPADHGANGNAMSDKSQQATRRSPRG